MFTLGNLLTIPVDEWELLGMNPAVNALIKYLPKKQHRRRIPCASLISIIVFFFFII